MIPYESITDVVICCSPVQKSESLKVRVGGGLLLVLLVSHGGMLNCIFSSGGRCSSVYTDNISTCWEDDGASQSLDGQQSHSRDHTSKQKHSGAPPNLL